MMAWALVGLRSSSFTGLWFSITGPDLKVLNRCRMDGSGAEGPRRIACTLLFIFIGSGAVGFAFRQCKGPSTQTSSGIQRGNPQKVSPLLHCRNQGISYEEVPVSDPSGIPKTPYPETLKPQIHKPSNPKSLNPKSPNPQTLNPNGIWAGLAVWQSVRHRPAQEGTITNNLNARNNYDLPKNHTKNKNILPFYKGNIGSIVSSFSRGLKHIVDNKS